MRTAFSQKRIIWGEIDAAVPGGQLATGRANKIDAAVPGGQLATTSEIRAMVPGRKLTIRRATSYKILYFRQRTTDIKQQ